MKKLIKTITILFFTIYLFSATEVYQLLKIPFLISHFNEHKEIDEKVNFVNFLIMHYTICDDNDHALEKDMKLPFKSLNSFALTSFYVLPSSKLIIKRNRTLIDENKTAKSVNFFASSFRSNIWQPPKTV